MSSSHPYACEVCWRHEVAGKRPVETILRSGRTMRLCVDCLVDGYCLKEAERRALEKEVQAKQKPE